jgi:hypothetical protein
MARKGIENTPKAPNNLAYLASIKLLINETKTYPVS